MKKFKLLPIALFLLSFAFVGCGESAGGGSGGGSSGGGSGGETSVIKSLTAKASNVDLTIGEKLSVSSYYEIKGYKTLSSKDRKVTVVSSDPTIVEISGSGSSFFMSGLIPDSNATITVTSQADNTKSCSFTVTVKDAFFDRVRSRISPEDDFSRELPADGGIIQSASGITGDYIFRKQASANFMVKASIAVNSVPEGDLWPKFGLGFFQVDEYDELTTDCVYVFLDGPMNRTSGATASWTDFGYCEVANGVYGWDSTPEMNRHKEDAFIKKTAIDYNDFFTLTAVVDGGKIHMFLGYGEGEGAKEVYMFTLQTTADVFGTRGFIPGFFQFNSIVTYKDYSYTTDATAIAAQMEGVTERLADYDHGSYEGTRYSEE